ncbi:MAG: S8 family serine peptidase [Gammaproteobacteria bacterium]|nr:S8 family serine peptidase [Gammaproteobacteria bacterium]
MSFPTRLTKLVIIALITAQTLSPALSGVKNDIEKERTINIVIVDDGLMKGIEPLHGFLWRNQAEIVNNQVDDDNNGLVDDYFGWDVADSDNDVVPPFSTQGRFSHGSHMALIIAQTVRQFLGDMDDYPIKIIPIKAISDSSELGFLKYGYEGLEHAYKLPADIINLSWSGGVITDAARQAFDVVKDNPDIVIVGAAGSFPQSDPSYPASNQDVIGVAGINRANKLSSSNYGMEVDLSALDEPAYQVGRWLPGDRDDDRGSSAATARVSATVALMKYFSPGISSSKIKQCLKNTATSIDKDNPNYPGSLGAGRLSTINAINCAKDGFDSFDKTNFSLPEGVVSFSKQSKKGSRIDIEPTIKTIGLRLKPRLGAVDRSSRIAIYQRLEGQELDKADSQAMNEVHSPSENEIIWSGLVRDLPASIDTTVKAVSIKLFASRKVKESLFIEYEALPFDPASEFCSGLEEVALNFSERIKIIEDKSWGSDYANLSDCSWLVRFPAEFDLNVEILELDTQEQFDSLSLFNGGKPLNRDLIASVSGRLNKHEISQLPRFKFGSGVTLLWFLSDAEITAGGFKIKLWLTEKSKN